MEQRRGRDSGRVGGKRGEVEGWLCMEVEQFCRVQRGMEEFMFGGLTAGLERNGQMFQGIRMKDEGIFSEEGVIFVEDQYGTYGTYDTYGIVREISQH